MRVAITGGAGLIGRATALRLLEAGHEVAVLDAHLDQELVDDLRNRFGERSSSFQVDVRDDQDLLGFLERHLSEAVVHLAAALGGDGRRDPWRTIEINAKGSINVMKAVSTGIVQRVVLASTAAVYGDDSKYDAAELPITERSATHVSDDVTVYGGSKLLVENVARFVHRTTGAAICGLRPSVVYGPGMGTRAGSAVSGPSAIVDGALRGQPVKLHSSTARVPMVHVSDVAGQIDALLATDYERLAGTMFFNTGGDSASLLDVAEVVEEIIPGSQIEVTSTGEASYVGLPSQMSDDALVRATGYVRRFSPLRSGIRQWIEVEQANR